MIERSVVSPRLVQELNKINAVDLEALSQGAVRILARPLKSFLTQGIIEKSNA